jgi:hypothetical protein
MIEEATSAGLKLRVATSGKFYYGLVSLVGNGEAAVATFAAVNNSINNVPINVPYCLQPHYYPVHGC